MTWDFMFLSHLQFESYFKKDNIFIEMLIDKKDNVPLWFCLLKETEIIKIDFLTINTDLLKREIKWLWSTFFNLIKEKYQFNSTSKDILLKSY